MALTVKLAVENPLPVTKVEFTAGYGDDFASYNSPFQVRIGVNFAGVAAAGGNQLVGRELFKSYVEVVIQAGFIIIDKNAGGDVHGVGEVQPS